MKLLITGAFGNLGLMCIEQALAAGHQLRCFDLDTAANRCAARRFGDRVEVVFGDIRDATLYPQLAEGIDALIHNASMLPPLTESAPELARAVNVDAALALFQWLEQAAAPPVVVFPSSVTVFGLPGGESALRSADDPVCATDQYTRHKLTVEDYLRASTLPWVILRVGVSVDARTLSADRGTLRQLLQAAADNPLEYVHPRDVALAMCNAASRPAARGRVLLIGGGDSCRITQHGFLSAAIEAAGLTLPRSAHGRARYYTHWMDTREAQAVLEFQRHPFSEYQRELRHRLRWIRRTVAPLRWLLNPLLARALQAL